MLLAGGGADYFSADGGAFMFAMGNSPSSEWWADGSAFMLLAGAGVSSSSAQGGAFPFNVDVLPLMSDWSVGSAII